MLETLYFIASIVAAAAVVGSLIFVGLQIRANTRENVLSRQIEGSDNYQVFQTTIIENADFRDIWLRGNQDINDLSSSELLSYGAFLAMWVDSVYRYRVQRSAGYEMFSWEEMQARFKPITRQKGAHQWWQRARSGYEEEIRQMIDEMLENTPTRPDP